MYRTAVATASVILIGILVSCNHEKIGLSAAYAITYDERGLPSSLSGDEFVIVRDTALSDPRVQELIAGRNYVISSCCGFVHNSGSSSSAPWQPVINFSVANKLQIGVSIDLDAHKVTSIYTMPYTQFRVPKSDTTTAAEEVAERSASNGSMTSMPFLATNTTTVLPLMLTIGIVIGGAIAGIFYYSLKKKDDDHLATEEKTG